MLDCDQCPRHCHAPRGETGAGACGMGEAPVVARAAPHFDEEPCISGTRGSGTVFFSGCALKCVFCQNEPISHGGFGQTLSVGGLRRAFDRLIALGVHNINLVNPTHFAHAIDAALREPLPVPVVWNSSGYESVETLRRFEGRVQVYLPDLKYITRDAAARYAGAPDYFDAASRAILEMHRQVGAPVLHADGIIQRGLIVRHLILPGQVEAAMGALDWIAGNLPGAWVSLMAQYLPCAHAHEYPEIDRAITEAEYDRVVNHLYELGLEEGYVQELESSDARYIPAFDLTGLEGEQP